MKKKFVCVLMALAMVFALAACGQNNDTPSNNDSNTPSTDNNDTPSTDNNSGSETLKIGAVGPLTGGYANYGLSVKGGVGTLFDNN